MDAGFDMATTRDTLTMFVRPHDVEDLVMNDSFGNVIRNKNDDLHNPAYLACIEGMADHVHDRFHLMACWAGT